MRHAINDAEGRLNCPIVHRIPGGYRVQTTGEC